MKKIKMKTILRIFIVVLGLMVITAGANVKAGYTYDNDGQIIISSEGFTASTDGIYNVISDAWAGKIAATDFTSPEDLYLYTEEYEDDGEIIKRDIVYVVDSASNKLFIFDENMKYLNTITKYEVVPENFTNTELLKFKTRLVTTSSTTSILLTNKYSFETIRAVEDTPYEERTDTQKFYIEPFKLSGVYRSTRNLRDENNVIIEGQYQDLLYLCDAGNNQILIVDANTFKVVQVVTAPTDVTFEGKVFEPTKVVTDSTGRMYVISNGIYEGIVLMSNKGNFMRFVGVNYTTLSFWDALWRNLATETQREQMSSILQTEFKNFAMDDKGFIYTVSRASTNPDTGVTDDTAMIKRINQAGNDVLTRNGYEVPKGDLVTIKTGTNAGGSQFTGIAVNEYGVYTVCDAKNGRLFTYDNEGNLLYISAGSGVELNNLNNPVAVRYQGENLLVLDKYNKAVIRYEPTEIAKLINKAVKCHFEGDLAASSEEWQNVISENPNYQYAYVGIGKTYLNDGRYLDAMSYFETGVNVEYYSKAYKLYRDGMIKKYFPIAMSVVLVLVAVKIGFTVYKRIKYKGPEETGIGDE